MKKIILIGLFIGFYQGVFSQLMLDADGPGSTYELITSKLAPNYDPIEEPDCSHPSFGRHIDEIFDAELNQHVFRFFMHANDDDDRCINFDRQRNEIKSYNQSPDSLLGVQGETFIYKWKFKIDAGFQSSPKFTHIHQLKAVGGSESSTPLITLTTRKNTPDELELRHAETTTQVTLHEVDLTPFKGVWCEATETVLYGENGTYDLIITKVSDGSTMFNYSNNDIRMWKTDASFVRPKWGIYRSLVFVSDLRDEEVLYANFLIHENPPSALPVELVSFTGKVQQEEILLEWQTASEQNNQGFEVQKSTDLQNWSILQFVDSKGDSHSTTNYNFLDEHPTNGQNFYRLKQVELDNSFRFSDSIVIDFTQQQTDINILPNPVHQILNIAGLQTNTSYQIMDSSGKKVLEGQTSNFQIDLSFLTKGVYFLQLEMSGNMMVKRFVKK